ncbi:MAG: UDP-N-acetylmuramoyl-tripeptide--D-alanyl-D-alanine ligase [Clostridia bacterium]|nr:UDP-N-acetylmuramoyl-tripeptide--D-alanyl-D-alanine ligase [Clostridia bacterium]
MGIFISPAKTIECVVIALCFGLLLTLSSCKFLGVLQQGAYSGKKAVRWLRKKGNMYFERLTLLDLLCFLSSAVAAVCFSFLKEWAAVVSLVPFIIFFAVFIYADKKIALRIPAVRTARFKRLEGVFFFVSTVFSYLAATLLNFADYVWGNGLFTLLKYSILAILPVLAVAFACLANLIDKIYEVPRNRGYAKKATQKVKESGITVIGITGSYGKTSEKNILAAMLSKKYRVLTTPRSHNTPMGISATVNGADLKNYDVFIAEMGARSVGDIAELCNICPPQYAVVTGICPQHLETFETIDNIIKAKGEIFVPSCKKAYIAPDCADYFNGYEVEKAEVCMVTDIAAGSSGTQFTLEIGGQKVKISTKLLGGHCAYNIALAATVAYDMGVSVQDIAAAAQELDYVEHRLQFIQSGGVNILDDGYNSNVKGARAALEVLRTFGGRKIVVTPGMVELGILEEQENKQLGGLLCGLDLVILVGDTLIAPVKEGYLAAGGDPQKLIIKSTLKDAQSELKGKLQSGDTVLFLNDLPDIY